MFAGKADTELVARVLSAQDARAFGELVRRHQSRVRNFLRKLTGDMALADDLAQDSFMRAWDKLETYSGKGTFVSWVMKIAYTTFLQSRRQSKRYAAVIEQAGHTADAEARTCTIHSDELPDLGKLLAVLNEEERAIMVMSYACGLSHREIGDVTGSPVGTVKSILHRGKEKIRTHFEIEDRRHG